MRVVCVSSSNVKHAGDESTSVKVCHIIGEIAQKQQDNIDIDIIRLADSELNPCIGCGHCFKKGECPRDQVFNSLYSRIARADGLFVVAAHYAPIPSKLAMLLEKMEQLAFLPRFHNEMDRSPLYHKPVGIVAHGGGTVEIIRGYKGVVLDTIANALSWPIEMEIVGATREWPNGIAFPIAKVEKSPSSIFPIQHYDWEDIRERVEPLVLNVMEKM